MNGEEAVAILNEIFKTPSKASYILIECPDCNRAFELIEGQKNEVCEHLRKQLCAAQS